MSQSTILQNVRVTADRMTVSSFVTFLQSLVTSVLNLICPVNWFRIVSRKLCGPVEYSHCPSLCFAIHCLEAKCALMDQYIMESLDIFQELEVTLNLQTMQIQRELNYLATLTQSSEHMRNSVTDCFTQHKGTYMEFQEKMTRANFDQELEEKLQFMKFEKSADDLKEDLIKEERLKEKVAITERVLKD